MNCCKVKLKHESFCQREKLKFRLPLKVLEAGSFRFICKYPLIFKKTKILNFFISPI